MAEMVLQGLSLPVLIPPLRSPPIFFSPLPLKCFRFIQLCVPHQVGLRGENLGLHSLSGSSAVEWFQGNLISQRHPLTWYKVSISNFKVDNLVSFRLVETCMKIDFNGTPFL